MKQAKVVFVSTPTIGNLVPVVEFSKLLSHQNQNLSVTVLLINMPQRPLIQSYIDSLASDGNLEFLSLPAAEPPSPDQNRSTISFLSIWIENHEPHVRRALTKLKSDDDVRIAGFFVDMFCTSFIDVAEELDIPCYLYFASPASFLSFMLHIPTLDAQVPKNSEFGDAAKEYVIPGFENPVPVESFPPFMSKRHEDTYLPFLQHAKRYRETRGVVVNTFKELESYCLGSMFGGNDVGPVYPIGPVVDREGPARWHPDSWNHELVMKWLDNQLSSSVVFLTTGSMGSLNPAQIREIATGLERAGYRFLWSIREPPKSKLDLPNDYTDLDHVLPPGFSDRTKGKGMVCGWVPQVTILAHKAIGGFVSHCGWNSILEALCHGVPIGTWPIYAEQHLNAFQMVKELGLAVEITFDYKDGITLVSAEDVERGVRKLMDGDDEVREKVKEYSEMCKRVWMKNGSSAVSLGKLIEDLNI
ncbi:PREDICTED: anthocyanidin 3-O-glucosyltransferase 2-like [Ipomoea nil]|uniref:anthocyanidin 3-O-glucosyltransferase 2-like n=1 Tax=Ipomoea nil TaxID=35883 RepID=UPI000901B37C|nr:PREDICTED: anthocyanidin 3-O-glucosyltransferase 2-like [Ipomoea nil]